MTQLKENKLDKVKEETLCSLLQAQFPLRRRIHFGEMHSPHALSLHVDSANGAEFERTIKPPKPPTLTLLKRPSLLQQPTTDSDLQAHHALERSPTSVPVDNSVSSLHLKAQAISLVVISMQTIWLR